VNDDKIRLLQQEKTSVEKQLVREKQEKMALLNRIKNMENQRKDIPNQGQPQGENIEYKLKTEKEIQSLNRKVKELEKKSIKNDEVEKLKKELEE
jgi:hypothetical protein